MNPSAVRSATLSSLFFNENKEKEEEVFYHADFGILCMKRACIKTTNAQHTTDTNATAQLRAKIVDACMRNLDWRVCMIRFLESLGFSFDTARHGSFGTCTLIAMELLHGVEDGILTKERLAGIVSIYKNHFDELAIEEVEPVQQTIDPEPIVKMSLGSSDNEEEENDDGGGQWRCVFDTSAGSKTGKIDDDDSRPPPLIEINCQSDTPTPVSSDMIDQLPNSKTMASSFVIIDQSTNSGEEPVSSVVGDQPSDSTKDDEKRALRKKFGKIFCQLDVSERLKVADFVAAVADAKYVSRQMMSDRCSHVPLSFVLDMLANGDTTRDDLTEIIEFSSRILGECKEAEKSALEASERQKREEKINDDAEKLGLQTEFARLCREELTMFERRKLAHFIISLLKDKDETHIGLETSCDVDSVWIDSMITDKRTTRDHLNAIMKRAREFIRAREKAQKKDKLKAEKQTKKKDKLVVQLLYRIGCAETKESYTLVSFVMSYLASVKVNVVLHPHLDRFVRLGIVLADPIVTLAHIKLLLKTISKQGQESGNSEEEDDDDSSATEYAFKTVD